MIEEERMAEAIHACGLFKNISDKDIEHLLNCSQAHVAVYNKGQMIFDQNQKPLYIHVLLDGAVDVGKFYADGRVAYVNRFENKGEVFGEILLFLEKDGYSFFAQAGSYCRVLKMPKEFLTHQCGKACFYHGQLTQNLLHLFADKAYFLNNRIQILSGSTLRNRIAKTLMIKCGEHPERPLSMTREDLAGFINATRPSVSRELSKMNEEGIIHLKGQKIFIKDMDRLSEYAE